MVRLAALCLRSPRAAWLALAGVTALLAAGLPRLSSEVGYRAFLGEAHPAIARLDAFAARFGGGLPFAAVWSCAESPACEEVFDAASLRMAHDVARAVEAAPGVVRVDGPATSPLLVRPELGLPEARRLAPDGEPASDVERLAALATRDATWKGNLVSADGRAGAIVVQLRSSDPDIGVQALAALREALAPYERAGFHFELVGGPVEFVVAGGELERATRRVVPVMVALVGGVLALLFRRPAPALVGLAGVGVAVVWMLGLMGWLGWPQNSLTQVLPPLVLVIGVCDGIHLLATYGALLPRDSGASPAARRRALLEAVATVGGPCLFTTLTTVAGLLSFLASGLESFARFGVVAAWGVTAALILSFSLVPLLVVRLPSRWTHSARTAAAWERGLGAAARLSPRAARAVVAAALAAGALGAAGLARLEVDARFEDLYGEESQVVRWVRGASRHLRAAETLEIAIELPESVRPDDGEALRTLERVEELARRPGLGRALSVLSPMRDLSRMLHGEELDLVEPADGARPGQIFRLLRAESPAFTRLFADWEDGALRVSFQAEKSPQKRLRALLAEVDAHLAAVLPAGYRAVVTGPLATVAVMIDEIRATQLASFALAGALVLVLIAVFFRSLSVGAMALVPTLLPVLVTLGAMGWLGIALDVGSAMVAAVVLGLAVDDAIHLLSAYRRRLASGESMRPALAGGVCDVGRALVTTSAALVVGFAALALSPWKTVASFGLIAAIAVLGALLADLAVLPALVAVATKRRT